MPKLIKIYQYIDSLYPMYGNNTNIKNYVGNVIDEFRWGEQKYYLHYINLISNTSLYIYYELSNVDIENIDTFIESIKKNCKSIIEEYTNSYETYEDKEILLELSKLCYLKHINNPYVKHTINSISDILLYSIYLKWNKL